MDPARLTLEHATDEVLGSRAWSELSGEAAAQLQHSELLVGSERSSGQAGFRTFSDLSAHEKMEAVRRASRALEKTRAYSQLQRTVLSSVDRHFGAVLESPTGGAGPSHLETSRERGSSNGPQDMIDVLGKACGYLLLECPQLKHVLRRGLNHPIPPGMRSVAWRVVLQCPFARSDFISKAGQDGVYPVNPSLGSAHKDVKRINQRCKVLLGSNPTYQEMCDSINIVKAMQSVMAFWRVWCERSLQDTDLLLLIPFLHVRREDLRRWGGDGGAGHSRGTAERAAVKSSLVRVGVVADIAEQYTGFMEMLPLAVQNSGLPQAQEALTQFALQVEHLLSTEDRKLSRHLHKVLGTSSSSSSDEGQLPFHKRLRNVLQPHVHQMLVGTLSMDVVCFIWDQFLIGVDCPDYQCLQHYVAVWLVLMKEKLLRCRSVKEIEEALTESSHELTVRDFEDEIERRFLDKLFAQLGTSPIRLGDITSALFCPAHPPHSEGGGRRRAEGREVAPKVLDPETGEHRPEKEALRLRVTELERRLEKEQRDASTRLDQEREEHRVEMGGLMEEVQALMKKMSSKFPGSVSHASTLPQFQPSVTGLATNTSNAAVSSPIGSGLVMSPVSPTMLATSPLTPHLQLLHHPVLVQTDPPLPQQSSTGQTGNTGVAGLESGERPYSVSRLSKKDVEDIWMTVLTRFTKAAYLVCHGTNTERQQLIQQQQHDDNHN